MKTIKAVILYKSKTGFTEKYAKWLAESLACECISYDKRANVNLADYDTVIYGGSIHAGMIGGMKWYKEQLPQLKNKTNIVFATGACPSEACDFKNIIAQNFTEEQLSNVKVFYLQSGLCYEKMGFGSRLMMSMFRKMMANKKDKTKDEESMSAIIEKSFDCSDRTFLEPILSYLNEQNI